MNHRASQSDRTYSCRTAGCHHQIESVGLAASSAASLVMADHVCPASARRAARFKNGRKKETVPFAGRRRMKSRPGMRSTSTRRARRYLRYGANVSCPPHPPQDRQHQHQSSPAQGKKRQCTHNSSTRGTHAVITKSASPRPSVSAMRVV